MGSVKLRSVSGMLVPDIKEICAAYRGEKYLWF
jgi:hypothetical protein